MKSADQDPLLHAWDETRKRRARDPAIYATTGENARTFSEIEEESRAFERKQLAQFRRGEVVAIQTGNHPAWPALLIACLRRALVILPLERAMAPTERDVALKVCQATALVECGDGEEITVRSLENHPPAQWNGVPPSLLKLTSGTTAAPRAIRFQSEQLLADCAQICSTMGITEQDLNFAVVPLSHSYGFSNLVTPLLARGVAMALSRDRMPRAILDDLARTSATVFPGMPVFYQAFCEMDEIPPLPNLRLCISAGAPLPLKIARKFREKFNRSIHSFYGSSECGGICYDRQASLLEPGFVGQPMDGLQLDLIEPTAPATRVRIRSGAGGTGYFPEPDEERLSNGIFMPDDLLSVSGDGFRIVGRVSDLINVAGKKVNPTEVEAELLRFDGVCAAVVFGRESSLRNEEVVACVVVEKRTEESALREFCRGRLSGWQVPKRIFFVEEIPINERGKISRRELALKFRD